MHKFLILIALLCISLLLLLTEKPEEKRDLNSTEIQSAPMPPAPKPAPVPPIKPAHQAPKKIKLTLDFPKTKKNLGDSMLAGYGEFGEPVQDLISLDRFFQNVLLLVKNHDSRSFSTNQDLVEFLQGANANHTIFLGEKHKALDSKNRLIDRHGMPLIVHPIGKGSIQIRSSGEDGIPYNQDDLVIPKTDNQILQLLGGH